MEETLLVTVAVLVLGFGLFSRKSERSILTPPMFFLVAGCALSEHGLGWVMPEIGGGAIHLLAELTLVLVLFTDAARIDLGCLRREGNLPARLLAFGMPLTILAGAGVALVLLPGIGTAAALLLAAILAPTDAALGQAVVSSPLVPPRIRQTLNVESGLNDGIALPVVLVLASVAGASGGSETVGGWLRFAALQVTLGPLAGLAVGWLGGRLVARGTRAGWINGPFQRLSALGLAALAFGGAEMAGGNGFIAAFVAGLVVGNVARGACECLYEFAEAEGQLLTLLVFLAVGGVLAPRALEASRRVDGALRPRQPDRRAHLAGGVEPDWQRAARARASAFLGWFGPRGLASILFVLVVAEEMLPDVARIEATVITTVVLSTFLHGISAYPLARAYSSRMARVPTAAVEHAGMAEMPVRVRHEADSG